MLKKLIAVILVICCVGCLVGCSEQEDDKSKKYVIYVNYGCLGGDVYIFDGKITNKNGGNVKCVPPGEYEKKKDNYDDMEADISGTYKWTPENETVCITLKREDYEHTETYFAKGDFLISENQVGLGVDTNMTGNYLDCKVQSILNVTEFNPDGTYSFYSLDPETYKPTYKSLVSGVYYISEQLVYTKDYRNTEYIVSAFICDNQLYDLSLSSVLKRDK